MLRRPALTLLALAVLIVPDDRTRGDDAPAPVRAVLVAPARVSPAFLAAWKARGATGVVVPLDETARPHWAEVAGVVETSGMTLWPWVEVARSPAMAGAHPEWMAAIGAHHDDWRRRFPDAPRAGPGEVIKAWPWVPIGYAPAFDAHRDRLKTLLTDLPGPWAGVFLNDLQAGPSSCGCGNDQCRWALDYGSAPTAARSPGDDAAARLVASVETLAPGKTVVPVWVTECELVDLPGADGGTGHCGGVPCARNDCWPRYVRAWNPLVKATPGPVALALLPETFRRDPVRWVETDLALFRDPPRGGVPLPAARTVAVVQAWGKAQADVDTLLDRLRRSGVGWVLALDPIDQSWEPRVVRVPRP